MKNMLEQLKTWTENWWKKRLQKYNSNILKSAGKQGPVANWTIRLRVRLYWSGVAIKAAIKVGQLGDVDAVVDDTGDVQRGVEAVESTDRLSRVSQAAQHVHRLHLLLAFGTYSTAHQQSNQQCRVHKHRHADENVRNECQVLASGTGRVDWLGFRTIHIV